LTPLGDPLNGWTLVSAQGASVSRGGGMPALSAAVSGCRRTTRESQRFADQRGEVQRCRGVTHLTEDVKDAIWVLRAEGVSEAEIGRRLGMPKRTVSKYLQRRRRSHRWSRVLDEIFAQATLGPRRCSLTPRA
jgi:Sigma-70, region 4